MQYDYLVVGAGFFGSVFAREMTEAGRKVLIIDKNKHMAGHAHTENRSGIMVHLHGPHLFHTKSIKIWNYINRFGAFNHYQHKVKAIYKGKLFSLPFNMSTYNQMWGVLSPDEAQKKIAEQRLPIDKPANMEEYALSVMGPDLYHTLVYGYTKKQWRREPKELPAFLIRRLPMRFTYDDNYFDDAFQGVPEHGYTHLVENIIGGIDLKLETDFFEIQNWRTLANKLVYSGTIDRFFDYRHGDLEYLSLKFSHEEREGNYYGIGQMNHTDEIVPFTRVIEHKHFCFQTHPKTIISYEYPVEWNRQQTPYYPVNNDRNQEVYKRYAEEAAKQPDIIFGGRLGGYKYFNMDQTIAAALHAADKEICAEG